MTVNSIINETLEKIQSYTDSIMEDPTIASLIDDIIQEELTRDNYESIIKTYYAGFLKLNENDKSVDTIILLLTKILTMVIIPDTVEYDTKELSENYVYKIIPQPLLQNCILDETSCTYMHLEHSKISLIAPTFDVVKKLWFTEWHEVDDDFKEKISTNTSPYLILLKSILDSISTLNINEEEIIVFFPETVRNLEDQTELLSFLKLSILLEGQHFHKHYRVPNAKLESNLKILPNSNNQSYSQYQENIYILSEYNYSDDLLNKFFLLYTIIENFMFKIPVVNIVNRNEDFTIRKFKSLYSDVSKDENKAISDFFETVKTSNLIDTTIEEYINSKLDAFLTLDTNRIESFNKLLEKIHVRTSKGNKIDINTIRENFYLRYSSTVYMLRNAILHNKTTEFHITQYALFEFPYIVDILSEFIIPTLENVIYSLIIQNDSSLTYKENHIKLYG